MIIQPKYGTAHFPKYLLNRLKEHVLFTGGETNNVDDSLKTVKFVLSALNFREDSSSSRGFIHYSRNVVVNGKNKNQFLTLVYNYTMFTNQAYTLNYAISLIENHDKPENEKPVVYDGVTVQDMLDDIMFFLIDYEVSNQIEAIL